MYRRSGEGKECVPSPLNIFTLKILYWFVNDQGNVRNWGCEALAMAYSVDTQFAENQFLCIVVKLLIIGTIKNAVHTTALNWQ